MKHPISIVPRGPDSPFHAPDAPRGLGLIPSVLGMTVPSVFFTGNSTDRKDPHLLPCLTGVRLRVTHSPHGFLLLRSVSVYRHTVVNTPVGRWALIARGSAYSNRFPVPSGCGFPLPNARSAPTLVVSRPAQRSLAITACRLAESPRRPVCLEGSDGFVSFPRRFDSDRLERPSCRVGFAPTED